MTKTIMRCDRCGVDAEFLYHIPNPSYSGKTYYPENVPFSVYPPSSVPLNTCFSS